MGMPAPAGVGASGAPPPGDSANAVVTGSFQAVGASAPFAFYGAFNVAIWANTATALTTVAGSGGASVASAAFLAVGQGVVSKNVPNGTTIGAINGLNITLAFPPGQSAAGVLAGVDNAAQFTGGAWAGSVQLERSFDGGATWLIAGMGGGGQGAIYNGGAQNGVAVSIVVSEPERNVLYRLNCTSYASGVIAYRLSESGLAAMAWGVPPS